MTILLGVIGLFAVLSWIVAVTQAIAMARLAIAEKRSWRDWLFGWWKFDAVREMAGPAGNSHAMIYKRATLAFIFFVVLGVILSGWAASQASTATPDAAESRPINDWRVIPAEFAFNTDTRRAAMMPGTSILES